MTSKNSPGRDDAVDHRDAVPRKRIKHTHSRLLATPSSGAAEMFSSWPSSPEVNVISKRSTAATGVIDLTGSPPPAQVKRSPPRKRTNGIVRPTSFTPNSGPKKLPVRNLRTTPKSDPSQYYQRVLTQLDVALTAIFDGESTPYSMEELYSGVRSLCQQNQAPAVYKKLSERCEHHLSVNILGLLKNEDSAATAVTRLESLVKAWSVWQTQLVCLCLVPA